MIAEHTINQSTVGVEIATIELGNETFNIREVGGTLSSKWDSYLASAHCVCMVYVVGN